MSPVLLAVVIFDCRWRKMKIRREKRGREIAVAPSALSSISKAYSRRSTDITSAFEEDGG